jgi:chromosome segregation ATPase
MVDEQVERLEDGSAIENRILDNWAAFRVSVQKMEEADPLLHSFVQENGDLRNGLYEKDTRIAELAALVERQKQNILEIQGKGRREKDLKDLLNKCTAELNKVREENRELKDKVQWQNSEYVENLKETLSEARRRNAELSCEIGEVMRQLYGDDEDD